MQKSAKQLLREGWFDKLASLFKGKSDTETAVEQLVNHWVSEKEIEVGEDLPAEMKQEIYQFVESRFERALKAYEKTSDPVAAAVKVIMKLLDKRFESQIDELTGYEKPVVKKSKMLKR